MGPLMGVSFQRFGVEVEPVERRRVLDEEREEREAREMKGVRPVLASLCGLRWRRGPGEEKRTRFLRGVVGGVSMPKMRFCFCFLIAGNGEEFRGVVEQERRTRRSAIGKSRLSAPGERAGLGGAMAMMAWSWCCG